MRPQSIHPNLKLHTPYVFLAKQEGGNNYTCFVIVPVWKGQYIEIKKWGANKTQPVSYNTISQGVNYSWIQYDILGTKDTTSDLVELKVAKQEINVNNITNFPTTGNIDDSFAIITVIDETPDDSHTPDLEKISQNHTILLFSDIEQQGDIKYAKFQDTEMAINVPYAYLRYYTKQFHIPYVILLIDREIAEQTQNPESEYQHILSRTISLKTSQITPIMIYENLDVNGEFYEVRQDSTNGFFQIEVITPLEKKNTIAPDTITEGKKRVKIRNKNAASEKIIKSS